MLRHIHTNTHTHGVFNVSIDLSICTELNVANDTHMAILKWIVYLNENCVFEWNINKNWYDTTHTHTSSERKIRKKRSENSQWKMCINLSNNC